MNRSIEIISTSGLCFLLVLSVAGCAGKKPASPRPVPGEIAELHMLTMPMAMNLDSAPGADGFAVRIYPVRRNDPKPGPIKEGTLEIVMYDGSISGPIPAETKPLHTWTFSAKALEPHVFKTAIGTGYALTVQWGKDRPAQNHVTVLARYIPPRGQPITSAANSIAVVDH